MRKYRGYQEYLIESLKDPEEASAYLKPNLPPMKGLDSNSFPLEAHKNKWAILENIAHLFSKPLVRASREKIISNLAAFIGGKLGLKACLDESIETNEFSIFQLALRNVVEAQGGISEISSKMDVGRESFYKSLSQKGKPRFSTIMHALKNCGVEIDFHPLHKAV